MKFKFKLEKLLTHKNMQVDIDRKKFLDKQNELNEQNKNLQSMIASKKEVGHQVNQTVVQSDSWKLNVDQMNDYLIGQDLRIAQQNERLRIIEKEVEILRQILLKSLTEAKMVDKIKENKKSEFLKEIKEFEQKEIDEIATLRFGNRNN